MNFSSGRSKNRIYTLPNLCSGLIGGMDVYRSDSSPNKVCKLPIEILYEKHLDFRQKVTTYPTFCLSRKVFSEKAALSSANTLS